MIYGQQTMVFSKSRFLTLLYTDFTERTDFFHFLREIPCHPRDPCTKIDSSQVIMRKP
jgi:hypothetical protein